MNQSQLVEALAAEQGVSKAEADRFLKGLGAIVQKNLKAKGDEIVLPGIGKLSVDIRGARSGTAPGTGKPWSTPEKKVPSFSAAKALKDAVAG